jgi:hypothetical protein
MSRIAKNMYGFVGSVLKVFKNHYNKVQKKILLIFDI